MARTSTAISIARNVAASAGFAPPSSLVGTTDDNARILLALLNRGCQILAAKRGPFGESWPELTREHVITTQESIEWYALPQGFVNLIVDALWDRTTYRIGAGPVTPQEWQSIKGGLVDSVSLNPRYRIQFNPDAGVVQLRIDPVPGGGDTLAFEYLSCTWARQSVAGPVQLDAISSDSDIPIFPSHLVELDLEWRIRKAKGLSYSTELAEFEMERDRVFIQSIGLRKIALDRSNDIGLLREANIPETVQVV